VAVGRKPPFIEDLSPQAEEYPLLEAVTRLVLLKTPRAGEDLRTVEISDGTVIKCNYELCAKVVDKSNIQSKTPKTVTLILRDNTYASEINKYKELGEAIKVWEPHPLASNQLLRLSVAVKAFYVKMRANNFLNSWATIKFSRIGSSASAVVFRQGLVNWRHAAASCANHR
jgi:hypothetical protein